MMMRLRDGELLVFAPLVWSFYLERFLAKTQKTLSILRDSSFPVFQGADEGVLSLGMVSPFQNQFEKLWAEWKTLG